MQPKVQSEPAARQNGGSRRVPLLSAGLKQTCERVLASGLYHTGLLSMARRLERTHELHSSANSSLPRLQRFADSKFGILCYHRVGTEGVPLFSRLEPAIFEAQMRYLKKHYRIVSLPQLCQELREGRQVVPTLAITFDDGYRDLYTQAFPVLRKYQIPATIYLIGRSMETGKAPWYDRIFVAFACAPGPTLELQMQELRQFELSTPALRNHAAWETVCFLRSIPNAQRQKWCADFDQRIKPRSDWLENRFLTWDQVRTMHRGGVFFGAHTMTHPSVSRLDSADFHEEFVHPKQLLEDGLDSPVQDFAYPFGRLSDVSSAAEAFLVRTGYRSAVTTMEGFNSSGANLHMLNRLQVGDGHSMSSFAFSVVRMFLEAPPKLHSPRETSIPDEHAPQTVCQRKAS
jgi:peptidoglycan/xylan/chitin deacetylase (PgdA/CDA1 family)